MRTIDRKIVLIGKPRVGKTSFLFQLTDKKFLSDDKRKSTVGADISFFTHEQLYLRIWDTAGDQDHKRETYIYCYKADLMVFFIDLTCIKESIQYFQNIKEEIPEDAQYLVVFTKMDLIESKNMYSKQQLQEYTRQAFQIAGVFGISNYLVTSAKTNMGIQEVLPYWIHLLTPIIVPILTLPPPKKEKNSFLGLLLSSPQTSESEESPEPLVTDFNF